MLHICVLGNNQRHSIELMNKIIQNDMNSKPKYISQDHALMNDGTEYYALSHSQGNVRGRHIEQLIIANEELKNSEVYEYATYRLGVSYVPEEFLIQVYEY